MMRMIKKKINRILSLVLVAVTLVTTISGCAKQTGTLSTNEINTEEIAELISQNIEDYIDDSVSNATPVTISTDWEDYEGNVDTLVYGLLCNQYALCYDVFNAEVTLPDGTQIYGMAYSDYQYYLESDDEDLGYFPAGFIAYIGESSIPSELVNQGLEIYNLDYQDDNFKFVLAYDTEDYMQHCVVWNQYLQYGVDNGAITYKAQDFSKDICDESLGALYSYDEKKYLYDPDVGNYTYVTGESLAKVIDYSQLEDQINEILTKQDYYLSQVDVQKSAYIAQEAVNAFFLSKRTETFMGYDVSELISIANEINPMECIQLTPDGMVLLNIEPKPPKEPTALVKWVAGITCGLVVIGCITATIFVPALAPASGAISAAAVEVFMEVIFENQTLENVNWLKVGVAAVSGALLAWACPALAGAASKGMVKILGTTISKSTLNILGQLAGYSVLTLSNSVVGGATNATFVYIDGKSGEETLNAFLFGAALSGALTIGTIGLSSLVSAGMTALETAKPNNWLSKVTNKAAAFIGDHQVHLPKEYAKLESVLAPKSVYAATRSAIYEVTGEVYIDKATLRMICNQLPANDNKNFILTDLSGNPITKEEAFELGGNCILKLRDTCTDPKILQVMEKNNVTQIIIKDGIPDLKDLSVFEFAFEITPNRGANMAEYKKYLAEYWSKNPNAMPTEVKEALLTNAGASSLDEISLTATKIGDALSSCSLTFHEGADGVVYLVDTYVHSKLSHYGGVGYASIVQEVQIGMDHFEDLLKSQPAVIVGTLIVSEG